MNRRHYARHYPLYWPSPELGEHTRLLTCADNPKQIYHCDFPDCHRSFVRQDLCARHKERHTARGSQLLRKDTFMQNLNPIVTAAMANKPETTKLGPMKNSPTVCAVAASPLRFR